jgi:hypothetical protein
MRAVRSGWFLGLMFLPGCSVADKLVHNLIIDPAHYDRYSDKIGRCWRDKDLAHDAWDEICVRDGDIYSRHYYRGFIEGFTDYLQGGGTGDPPVLPPRSYWRLYYQTPEGHQAIEDWFAGFRHGADVAKASGVRDLVLVPASSLPPSEISDISGSGGTNTEPTPPVGPTPPAGTTPTDREKLPLPGPVRPSDAREGPMVQRTVNGKPMPPPSPPVIQVERMIAPPVPKTNPMPPK